MAYGLEKGPAAGPGVEWIAGQIPSPILRLRFLQEFVPRPTDHPPLDRRKAGALIAIPLALLLITTPPSRKAVQAAASAPRGFVLQPVRQTTAVYVAPASDIWLVEKTAAYETYSNGLRIDNRFATRNHPRSYLVFSASRPETPPLRRVSPAGIVFHTTESMQAPFEADQNSRLKRIGESLLEYVQRRRSYNFVIDRFGRVYRVVEETDAANHAGYSVWSDADWLYLNLNEGFLGVSFETKTVPGQGDATVTPAQMLSGAMLIDMLRHRYRIPAVDCVTHAQVSVNPSNLQIGYHLDWASSFPFRQLGLPDNYDVPLPAVGRFGFGFDAGFAHRAGERMFGEAQRGEQEVRDSAAAAHMQTGVYRGALQKRYRSELAAVRDGSRAE